MKMFALGRRKVASALCHNLASPSSRTSVGEILVGLLSAPATTFAGGAPGASHTSAKSVGMNGLGSGQANDEWTSTAAHAASNSSVIWLT